MMRSALLLAAVSTAAAMKASMNISYGAARDCRACPSCECLDLYEPEQPSEKLFIFLHGGLWYSGSRSVGQAVCQSMVDTHNMACASVDYVFSADLGGCCTSAACNETVSQQAAQVVAAYAKVRELYPAAKEVYIGGHSAGGHLSMLLATSWKKRVGGLPAPAGFVGIEGIYDAHMWSDYDRSRFGGQFDCVTKEAFGSSYDQFSPALTIGDSPAVAPVFLIHSREDTYVQMKQAVKMYTNAKRVSRGNRDRLDVNGKCVHGEHDDTLQGGSSVTLAECIADFMSS